MLENLCRSNNFTIQLFNNPELDKSLEILFKGFEITNNPLSIELEFYRQVLNNEDLFDKYFKSLTSFNAEIKLLTDEGTTYKTIIFENSRFGIKSSLKFDIESSNYLTGKINVLR